MSNNDILTLMSNVEHNLIQRKRVEARVAHLQALLSESRSEVQNLREILDGHLEKIDTLGVSKRSIMSAAEDRVETLIGNGLISLEDDSNEGVAPSASSPAPKRARRRKTESVAEKPADVEKVTQSEQSNVALENSVTSGAVAEKTHDVAHEVVSVPEPTQEPSPEAAEVHPVSDDIPFGDDGSVAEDLDKSLQDDEEKAHTQVPEPAVEETAQSSSAAPKSGVVRPSFLGARRSLG